MVEIIRRCENTQCGNGINGSLGQDCRKSGNAWDMLDVCNGFYVECRGVNNDLVKYPLFLFL